jgi:hypothetical protein
MSIADVTFSLSGITEFGGVKRKADSLGVDQACLLTCLFQGFPDSQR